MSGKLPANKEVLQYDTDAYTIGQVVKKKSENTSNPLLANLTKRNQRSGFSSIAPRFNAKTKDEAETFIGPGYYEQ